MNRRREQAEIFRRLHVPGNPLVLVNIWDAGSAKIVAESGAVAIATSSWSVAAAMGEADGERLSFDDLLEKVGRIARAVDLPLTVDFESGYSEDVAGIHANTTRLIEAGAIGCNLEDGIPGNGGVRTIDAQVARVAAARNAARDIGIPLFINARTDGFLLSPPDRHAGLVDDAIARARAYAGAGADGFFVPGLVDPELIAAIVKASPLPVNVMVADLAADLRPLAEAGVARISFGPYPWILAMNALRDAAARTHTGIGP